MWDEVYEKLYPELLRYCTSACHDKALAEDLCQETFLKALQNTDTFEDLGPSQRRAWLYRTMKNLLVDRFRRTALEESHAITEQTSALEPGYEQAETALLLAALPEQDRILFQLRYLEGYNASELSEMFGLPTGTIRSRLSRSRKLLQQMLLEK